MECMENPGFWIGSNCVQAIACDIVAIQQWVGLGGHIHQMYPNSVLASRTFLVGGMRESSPQGPPNGNIKPLKINFIPSREVASVFALIGVDPTVRLNMGYIIYNA